MVAEFNLDFLFGSEHLLEVDEAARDNAVTVERSAKEGQEKA
jgi:hypothetical protein